MKEFGLVTSFVVCYLVQDNVSRVLADFAVGVKTDGDFPLNQR